MLSDIKALDRRVMRDICLVCLANGVVGVSFGAIAVTGGLPAWVPLAMSPLVFAGGAQFAFLGIVLTGGGVIAAALTALFLNTRLVPLGLAVAELFRGKKLSRYLWAHVVTDEGVAFTLAQPDKTQRRGAFFAFGALMFVMWTTSTVIGVMAGRAIGDPLALGLDAAGPMVLLALVAPAMRTPRVRRCALIGAALALVSLPFLPPGLPVLAALAGVLAAGRDTPPLDTPPAEMRDETREDPIP